MLVRAGFYGLSVVHRDHPDGKRCSLVISDGWKRALGVSGAKQGLVAGKVNHGYADASGPSVQALGPPTTYRQNTLLDAWESRLWRKRPVRRP